MPQRPEDGPHGRIYMATSVLIADDDPSISRALSFLMQREGHEVRTVTDGEQALAAIEMQPPDVVLLDIMMPKGNGYEICRTFAIGEVVSCVKDVLARRRSRTAPPERARRPKAGAANA